MKISHSKLLDSAQFDAIRGSTQHAVMMMNSVFMDEPFSQAERVEIVSYLAKNAKGFYHHSYNVFGDKQILNMRIYFLSKHDMESFLVWARLKFDG